MADKKPPISADDLMGDEPVKAPSHAFLSDDDVQAARDKARKRIEAERRAAALKAIEEDEVRRLRVEEGLTTGIGVMDEMVDITIDLPLFSAHVAINGPSGPQGSYYYHGLSYTVPRHVANTLAEMMFRAWRHDDQVEGKSLAQFYQRKHATVINARTGAVTNAPRRFDA